MSNQDLIDFGIWRDVGESLDEEAQYAAAMASEEAIEELSEEGIEIEHVLTDVLVDAADDASCVYCHYRAPTEEAIREHSTRAGSRIDTNAFTVSKLTELRARHEE